MRNMQTNPHLLHASFCDASTAPAAIKPQQHMPRGTLQLTIADGRNLKDQDLLGKMYPYVNFQLAAATNVRAKWRCKTHANGGKNPSWNDRHNFDVVEGDDRIQAQVYDEDTASDDLIGQASIDLNTVFARGMRDEWFPLQARLSFTPAIHADANTIHQSKSGRPAGEIRVILQFTPSGGQAAAMPGAMPGNVRPPTYGAPYGAPPAYGGNTPHDVASHFFV